MTFETSVAATASTDERPARAGALGGDARAGRLGRGTGHMLGPILLYVLIAAGILWPYRSAKFRGAGDLSVVMALVSDAEYALREHQFPLRVAPHLHDGLRYPLYQYYGNFPYTLTGALSAGLHIGPYAAWKLVMLASLVLAGIFMMRLALVLTRRHIASVLAGAVFLTAPYLWTDINARGAFCETVAFDLLPVAFYFTLRCFQSRLLRYIPLCAVAWALIGLAHNITYLYGVTFTSLFLLPRWRARGLLVRLGRLTLAGALHALLILWYVAPQLMTLHFVAIGGIGNPIECAPLTPWHILLAPVLTNTLMGASTPGLGLQVGWPILAGVLLATGGLFRGRRRLGRPLRLTTATLLALFAVAFLLAWTPFDVWRILPKVFWFAQFPYRLLMWVVLFGSLLTACGLATFLRRGAWPKVAIATLALLGLGVSSYVPARAPLYANFVRGIHEAPGVVSVDDYLSSGAAVAPTSWTTLDPEIRTWAERLNATDSTKGAAAAGFQTVVLPRDRVRIHTAVKCEYTASRPVLLELPVLYYPGLLEVRDNRRVVAYANAGRFLAIPLQPGPHRLEVRFIGLTWANVLGWIGWGGVGAMLLAGMLRRRRPRRVRPACDWRAGATRSAFAPTTALAGFGAMAACAVVPTLHPLKWLRPHGPKVTASSSSRAADACPQWAFDDDTQTAWLADDSGPATLTARFAAPALLHGLELEPRVTGLYEGYSRVGVVLFLGGRKVYQATFDFPNAAHQPTEVIRFPSTRADAVELDFSDPILETHDGRRVPANMVRPGYAEVRIQWD